MEIRTSISFIIIIFLACSACTTNSVVISFKNNSDKFIDSGVFYLNNYKFSIMNVKPTDKIDTKILRKYILSNKHDITLRAYVYGKNKTNIKGGFYYSDLSGSFNDFYQITVDSLLNTTIK